MPRHLSIIYILIATLLCGIPVSVSADTVIELPVLGAIGQNNLGVFEILMMWWDKKPEPNPVQLQWLLAGVRLGNAHLGAMAQAFAYAVERTPSSNIKEPYQCRGGLSTHRHDGQAPAAMAGVHRHVWEHSARHCLTGTLNRRQIGRG
jgi:hypothetical protein